MATRRPIAIVGGRLKELPVGDTFPAAIVPRYVAVYDAAGNLRPLALSTTNTIPIFDASGNSRPLAASTT